MTVESRTQPRTQAGTQAGTQVGTADPLAALGLARVPPEHLDRLVAAALGAPRAQVEDVAVEVVDYPIGTPSTCALLRCRGTARVPGLTRPQEWSIFVKVLQSARAWPLLHLVPEDVREDFANTLPWRTEIAAHRSTLGSVLPDGLRLPRLYDIVEVDADHAAVWMEDVDVDTQRWSLARFEHAAELLGRLAARRPPGTHAVLGTTELEQTPGVALRAYVGGRVQRGVLPALASEELWRHPLLAGAVAGEGEQSLRAELLDAARHIDAWMDLLDTLPQTYVHGDASPQNLLVGRADSPRPEFVVIDWGFHCPQSVGFDLGQLVVGLAHSGEMDAPDLPPVVSACVAAYVRGLRLDGDQTSERDVRTGFVGSLVLRAMFTMIPLELLDQPDSPQLRARFAQRVRLTRYLLTLSQELPR